MSAFRLAAVYTHPIQYNTPIFRALSQRPDVDLTVFYTSDYSLRGGMDREFGRQVTWDIPLLDGHRYEFLPASNLPFSTGRPHWRICPDLRERLVRGSFDAVLLPGYAVPPYMQAWLTAASLDLPILMRGDNLDGCAGTRRSGVQAMLRKAMLRAIYRPLRGALAVGTYMVRHFEAHGVPRDRIFRSPHCVDNQFFRSGLAAAPSREALRRDLGLLTCDVVGLFCGKLIEKKGVRELAAAVSRMKLRKRLGLLIVGDGHLRAELENRLADAGVGSCVFAGFRNQTELPAMYKAADFLILPSQFAETWGLVVNEAMSCGLPAMVTDQVGCAEDLVLPGRTGWRLSHSDEQEFADALDEATNAPQRIHQMGQLASELVNQFSPEAAASGVTDALKSLRHAGGA